MSNRLFQSIIHQMRDAIDRTIGVVDETCTVIACSELSSIGEQIVADPQEVFATFGQKIISGKTFLTFGNNLQSDCAVLLTVTMKKQADMQILLPYLCQI